LRTSGSAAPAPSSAAPADGAQAKTIVKEFSSRGIAVAQLVDKDDFARALQQFLALVDADRSLQQLANAPDTGEVDIGKYPRYIQDGLDALSSRDFESAKANFNSALAIVDGDPISMSGMRAAGRQAQLAQVGNERSADEDHYAYCACGRDPSEAKKCVFVAGVDARSAKRILSLPIPYGHQACTWDSCGELFYTTYGSRCAYYTQANI
jgi:hypothetical protein